MNKLNIFFVIILLSTLAGCGEDEPPTGFSGITERDINGELSSLADETDWQHNDTWSNKEMALFTKHENLNNDGVAEATSNAVWYTFPNPTIEIVNIHLDNLEDIEFAEWKLVKNDFSEITRGSFSIAPKGFRFDLPALTSPGIYRMYYLYKFRESEYIFKGHGDVQVVR